MTPSERMRNRMLNVEQMFEIVREVCDVIGGLEGTLQDRQRLDGNDVENCEQPFL